MNTMLEINECVICGEIKEVEKFITFGYVSYWCEDCIETQEG